MTSSPETPRGARLPSLTGLRFAAALLVFAFHSTWQHTFIDGAAGDVLGSVFGHAGFYGVSFFFVLSGFVLTWSARPGDTAPRVWRRRFVKIYPNHLVTFVVAGALLLLTAQQLAPWPTLAGLFLVQSWVPDVVYPNTMNFVSWSLSCELLFYLCFPWLLRALNRVRARGLWLTAAAMVAVILVAPVVSTFAIGGTPLPFIADGSLSFEQIWFVYFFPPVRAAEFVLGMVAARLVIAGHRPPIPLLPALLVAVAGYAVNSSVPYLFGVAGLAALWLTPLVAAAAVTDLRATRSPFRGRTMVRLGEWSFAFYMVHGLVVTYLPLWLVQGRDLGAASRIGLLVLALALCLLLAYALFTWVESPAVRRFGSRRTTAAPPTAPVPVTVLEAKE
ncbi:acyltransferase [Sphaerisporangium rubeum]|uniref:Peptidoglycan/LPS O-acetylase OafA/YrhL n=1 Tax=Sphaerisporangium rubeum TaxID=321317 RepID=A0A7X0IKJ1_9ACTN|nr:acyltransferase [Sphaerisporangium rubeum]MBB6475377.1 peptidoglycan/LPS O-acetylase OafA/YrhL [Sphaerisporangium rubeum]